MNEHYRLSNIQPIEAITDWNLGYNAGTAIAYIARHERKGKPAEDLRKAIWHLVYELTESTELADTIVSDVEVATVVEWVDEEGAEAPTFDYTDGLGRYCVATGCTDGVNPPSVCFDSDDYEEARDKFAEVSNRFHCSHAVLVDRGAMYNGSCEGGCDCRIIEEWDD